MPGSLGESLSSVDVPEELFKGLQILLSKDQYNLNGDYLRKHGAVTTTLGSADAAHKSWAVRRRPYSKSPRLLSMAVASEMEARMDSFAHAGPGSGAANEGEGGAQWDKRDLVWVSLRWLYESARERRVLDPTDFVVKLGSSAAADADADADAWVMPAVPPPMPDAEPLSPLLRVPSRKRTDAGAGDDDNNDGDGDGEDAAAERRRKKNAKEGKKRALAEKERKKKKRKTMEVEESKKKRRTKAAPIEVQDDDDDDDDDDVVFFEPHSGSESGSGGSSRSDKQRRDKEIKRRDKKKKRERKEKKRKERRGARDDDNDDHDDANGHDHDHDHGNDNLGLDEVARLAFQVNGDRELARKVANRDQRAMADFEQIAWKKDEDELLPAIKLYRESGHSERADLIETVLGRSSEECAERLDFIS